MNWLQQGRACRFTGLRELGLSFDGESIPVACFEFGEMKQLENINVVVIVVAGKAADGWEIKAGWWFNS